MSNDSWVKNYRKIKKWQWYKKPTYSHLWQHLLREAEFRLKFNINGQKVERGQVDFSLRQLSQETGISLSVVRRILKVLENGTEISTVKRGKNHRDLTIISITNYDLYQSTDNEETQQTAQLRNSRGTVEEQLRHNPKKLKNNKNKDIYTQTEASSAIDLTVDQTSISSKKELFIQAIEYLNAKADTKYRVGSRSSDLLNSVLKDYTLEDIKHVVDKKCKEWLGTDMEKYLRPETLFNRNKFDSYFGQREVDSRTPDEFLDDTLEGILENRL